MALQGIAEPRSPFPGFTHHLDDFEHR